MNKDETLRNKAIGFCVTCRNRLWQLQETLAHNLSLLDSDMEISLVDYGSSDGLSEWVWSNFNAYIESGKLIFFEVTNEVTWNVSKAKNLAHRLSNGSYLFNLDADNFIDENTIQYIREASRLKMPSHQWSGSWSDGSFGRIGFPRELFYKLGGYDEAFLPMGWQDNDIINRLQPLGISYAKMPAPLISAIENGNNKVSELPIKLGVNDSKDVYNEMCDLNRSISLTKIKIEGPIRLGGFSSYIGKLNGLNVVIDGFDNLRALEDL